MDRSIEVDYRKDDVGVIIDTINEHIKSIDANSLMKMVSHEILLKYKVNLHKYLVAICCKSSLSRDACAYSKITPKFYRCTNFLNRYQN